jgi:hypothetical protein
MSKNAEGCLELAHETNEIYAKMALIELATEFQVTAQHLERERRANRLRRRVDSFLRSVRFG